jgi:hypothetical protein
VFKMVRTVPGVVSVPPLASRRQVAAERSSTPPRGARPAEDSDDGVRQPLCFCCNGGGRRSKPGVR